MKTPGSEFLTSAALVAVMTGDQTKQQPLEMVGRRLSNYSKYRIPCYEQRRAIA